MGGSRGIGWRNSKLLIQNNLRLLSAEPPDIRDGKEHRYTDALYAVSVKALTSLI
jgi:hypothetical protein